MRSSAPSLLPLFRSEVQGRLLAVVLARPEEDQPVSELARRLGAHISTVHREVERLERAGILRTHRVGRTRVVRAGSDCPYLPELSALVMKVFGPVPMLEQLLSNIPGLEDAYVFGSWAERYRGIPGPVPGDIDLLVVGRPNREQVYEGVEEVQRFTGIVVDVVIRSVDAWREGDETLLESIRNGPLLRLQLESR